MCDQGTTTRHEILTVNAYPKFRYRGLMDFEI
jgi:hypothetical protein